MKSKLLILCGFICVIPAIILVLNTCSYALIGSDFLIAGDESINGARMFVGWLSSTLAVCLFGAASCAYLMADAMLRERNKKHDTK
jgi:hypothetical protein